MLDITELETDKIRQIESDLFLEVRLDLLPPSITFIGQQ